MEDFRKYYETGLNRINLNLKKNMKDFRRACADFDRKKDVDLDPQININPEVLLPTTEARAYKACMEYSCDNDYIKRMVALSER